MKAEDLNTKTADELKKSLDDLKKQQFNLRFQRSQGALENTAQIRRVRRDIARVNTFLKRQESTAPAAGKAKAKSAAKPAKAKAAGSKKSGKQAA